MRTTAQGSPPVLPPTALRSRRPDGTPGVPETDDPRRDDWALAFAVRLAWLGARDGLAELARLGRSLYEHYSLLDPYHIARMVWRRRPNDGAITAKRSS
jgi:hypothetical protein